MTLRIGCVTNFLPAPADSGSAIRAARLARALARLGPVSLYCRTSDVELEKFRGHADLSPYARVRAHALPRPAYVEFARVFTDASMRAWMADDDPLAGLLAEDHRAEPFDVVVCAQLFTANVARGLGAVPVVLSEHNVESRALSEMVAAMPRADAVAERPRVEAVREYERAAWGRAALVVCVTEAEAAEVRARCATPVQVVPNGVAAGELPFVPPSRRSGSDVLFVGAFFWPPNVKAARFLAREVMPRVWKEEPAARLVLCGKAPGIEVALLRRAGIEVTGTVPSVRPYLERAAAYANAVFEGAGSPHKFPEALAAGVPVVSTAVGARGYPAVPGRHYLPAEDADGFARALLAVLRGRDAFDAMARDGRTLAEAFDWEGVGTAYASAVAGAARQPRSFSPRPGTPGRGVGGEG